MHSLLFKGLAACTLSLGCLSVQAADTIKIGSVVSATGPAAFLGDPQVKTLEMYVDSINQAGGVNGKQLELITYDDGSDAGKANSFAKRLIHNDEVDVIIGGSTSGAAMSMIPLAEKNAVPFITMAGAISIVEPVKKWVFKTSLTDKIVAEMVFADMQKRGIKKIALINENSGLGQSGKKESEKVAANYGIEIVANESFGAKDTDMTPQLTKIKNNPEVEATFVFGVGQGPALLTRNYQQLGIELPMYQSYAVCADEYMRIAGSAANGVRVPCDAMLVADALADDDPQKPVVTSYINEYTEKWQSEVSHFGGCAYDALMIYLDAVKRAGTTEKDAVRTAIEETKGLILTAGEFNMSATDHLGLDIDAYRMLEIKDGKWALAD